MGFSDIIDRTAAKKRQNAVSRIRLSDENHQQKPTVRLFAFGLPPVCSSDKKMRVKRRF
ncbi:MAG: hypothetical protein J6K46_08190 [Sutterella sp.]|nr:hypothetical protein [Sutterella sp.]